MMAPDETAALRRQLLGELVAEGLEHLDAADALLDGAEQGGLDAEARDGLMRAMHSIKGAAGYMELADIQGLAHALETIGQQPSDDGDEADLRLEMLRAGTAELRDLIEHADVPRPASGELLDALRSAGVPTSVPRERRRSSIADIFLDTVQQQCQALRAALPYLTQTGAVPASTDRGAMVHRALASLQSAAAYAGRDDVLRLLDAMFEDEGGAPASAGAVTGLLERLAVVVDGLPTIDSTAEVTAVRLDTLVPAHRDGEIVQFATEAAAQSSGVASPSAAPQAKSSGLARADAALDPFGTLRVPFTRVDALIGQAGELLTIRNQFDHFLGQVEATGCAPALTRQGKLLATSLGRAVDDLQNTARELRLVRLETLFRRLPRICRDAAAQTSKLVRLELHGGDTELDKTVAEALVDPLLHLLRNAIDHGIERPSERREAGKAEMGTVMVTARQEEAEVVIDVRDDGHGVDLERVRTRALESGLLDAETADELSAEGIVNLLFRPGFSTAASVTGISGRGVGLDVVQANVSLLGGSVAIRHLTPGTAFELRLPVRLTATDVVLVRSGGETFAVVLDGVRETLSVTADRVRQVAGRPAIVHQGQVVPLVSLAEVIGLSDGLAATSAAYDLVIGHVGGQPVGLMVDEIGRHQKVVAKPLEPYLARPGLSDAAVLGDGNVVLVVTVGQLIASALAAEGIVT